MSILRDLDPQNTPIQRRADSGGYGKKIAWTAAFLLLFSGLFWLFLADQSGPHFVANYRALAPTTSTSRSPTVPSTTQDYLAPVPPPDTEAALIRDIASAKGEPKIKETNEENPLQAMQAEFSKTGGEPPGRSARSPARQTASVDDNRQTTNSAKPNKSSRNTVGRSTSNGPRIAKGEKNSAERDIDIITALVK